MRVVVRPPRPEELDRLAVVAGDSYCEDAIAAGLPAGEAGVLADTVIRSHIRGSAESPHAAVRVADAGGDHGIVGACLVSVVPALKVTYVVHLWIDPAWLDAAGASRALFAAIEDLARERGTARLEFPVFLVNERLLQLCEQAGLTTAGFVMSARLA